MAVTITARNFDLDDDLKNYINARLSRVEKLYRRIYDIEVVLENEKMGANAEIIVFLQETKEIYTDSIVNISGHGLTAAGKGGMANSDEKRAVLNEDVKVRMEPSTTVFCDGPLEVEYNKNIAVFHKNVKVVDKDGKLFADKLTVEFDAGTKKLKQVVAEGNVKVKKGNSYTLSEKAIYSDSTKSAQLLGKPRIIIDPDELEEYDSFNGFGPQEPVEG